jgi:hypothetical protein
MTADGQQTLDGTEEVDPRTERVAKALWWADAKRTWGQDGPDVARETAARLWPGVSKHYIAEARIAIAAADGP